jgi:hypothetical protein
MDSGWVGAVAGIAAVVLAIPGFIIANRQLRRRRISTASRTRPEQEIGKGLPPIRLSQRVLATTGVVLATMLVAASTVLSKAHEPDAISSGARPVGTSCPLTTGPLAIAVAGRANAPSPVVSRSTVNLIEERTKSRSPVSVVGVDGNPRIYFQGSFSSSAKNNARLEIERRFFVKTVSEEVSNLRATTPEADLLAAINLAGRLTTPNGTIVLIDSGLQTMPPLPFQLSRNIDAYPKDVVAFLKAGNLLPDLRGRTIVLVGIGDVALPQTPWAVTSETISSRYGVALHKPPARVCWSWTSPIPATRHRGFRRYQ